MGSFKKLSFSSAFAVFAAASVCTITSCAANGVGDAVRMPPNAYVAGEEAKTEEAVVPAPVDALKDADIAPIAMTEEIPAPAPAPAEGKVVYTVRQGDSLWSIAKIYGLDERSIAIENNIAIDKPLTAGEKLVIPDGGRNVDPSMQVKLLAPAVKETAKGGTYTVQKGDSLWKIAHNHGITVDALAAANGLDPKKTLKVGTVLTIPAGGEVKVAAGKPASKKEAKKEVKKEAAKEAKAEKKAEEPKAAEQVNDKASYEKEVLTSENGEIETVPIVIYRDMDLEEVASVYDHPFELLKKLNPDIKPGEKIPANSTVQVPITLL